MALYDTEDINGVTKVESTIGFVYHFVLVIIETNTSQNSYKKTQRGQTTSENILLSHVDDTLGFGTVEGYIDQLAKLGEYSGKDSGAIATTKSLDVNINESILNKLKDIEFLLKSIAE